MFEAQQDDCGDIPEPGPGGWAELLASSQGRDDDTTLKRVVFQHVGRPSCDLREPGWPKMAAEMTRKGVTLLLLWEEYRAAHPDGYGYTWFCDITVHSRTGSARAIATVMRRVR